MVDIRHIGLMRALVLGKFVQRIHFSIDDSLLSDCAHHEISICQVAHYHLLFALVLDSLHDQMQHSVHAVV